MKRIATETIPFDDERMEYYYEPWKRSQTGDGPVIKTSRLNDYVDIWYLEFTHLEWWSAKEPTAGIAGFKIWGSQWEIQEMISLYSPTRDSKIELIKQWDFPPDQYTITLLNIGEKDENSIGFDLIHSHFVIS